MEYDCMVIGKGLIGSAAAKYLSSQMERVALVGPDEPSNVQEGLVFSSHYDETRIQRIIGLDETWTRLNQQSAQIYEQLQQETGIAFHHPVGCLYVNPHGKDAYLRQIEDLSKMFNHRYKLLEDGRSLKNEFPDFHFPQTAKGIFEGAPSGFINPRLLIQAQLDLFVKNRGTIIREVVESIRSLNGAHEIKTVENSTFTSKKILVAAGAFSNSMQLLPEKLSVKLKSETTILARISSEDAAQFQTLPSLLYEIDIPEIQNIYLLPPVIYPDGNYYLKMGGNMPGDFYFETLQEIQQWFYTNEFDGNREKLQKFLRLLVPDLDSKEFFTKRCIVTQTVHGKPYIGASRDKGVYVAVGGNGYGAMCSDALGKLASHLVIHDAFSKDFSADEFLPNYK